MRNRYGLDVSYITSGLRILVRDADNYRPDEMGRALRRFSDAVDYQGRHTAAAPDLHQAAQMALSVMRYLEPAPGYYGDDLKRAVAALEYALAKAEETGQ